MDDNTFHIPDQPQSPPEPPRPEGADSAADIARAKLQSIYAQQNTPTTPQQEPTAPQQPQPHQQPATFQPTQPVNDAQATGTNFTDATTDNSNQIPPVQAEPLSQPVQPPRPQSHNQFDYSQPAPQPETFQPQPLAASPPPQNYEHNPAQQSPPAPDIIQPTPAEPAPQPTASPTDFAIPGQPASPPPEPQTPDSNYIPSEQYAQEVSLEDQIDGLRHTAPDHQLPIQTQKTIGKSSFLANLQPLFRTLMLAAVIAIIYNHQFLVGQVQSYINPAQSVVSPVIISPDSNQNVGEENKLLIPKINVDVPVVYDITTFEESAVQAGLERGVVHYGNTALPGENGNSVIVGHSSNNFWNNGQYKFAFVLLNKLQAGDTFTLHYEGTAYTYEVFQRRIVPPTAVDVIFEDFGEPVVTLITCDPPGTAWNRLIVNARQISPDPDNATTPQSDGERPDEVITVPSDSTSLLDNLFN